MRYSLRTISAALAGGIAVSVLTIPAAGAATAATTPERKTADVSAQSIDATCKKKSRKHVVANYYRGPARYTLRCGTAKWGWKHIKKRHGWNKTMNKKINAAIWSGRANGRGGFSTYTAQCPSVEKFRTIIGTPAGGNDLLTAYKVNTLAGAKC